MDAIGTVFHYGEEVIRFLVFGVGLGYIGRKVIADYMIKKGRLMITKTARNSAIWQHYQRQAKGQGHASASVLDCGEEGCQVFGKVPQMV